MPIVKKHDSTTQTAAVTVLPKPAHPKPTFLSPAELAARWKVTPMTLRRWRKAGKLGVHHIGRGIRFSLEAIEKFEADSKA